ncbi:MAG: MCE family protein [Lentisphaeria bacterium]|nr:MCE family protein [Lentisphaeria bacterium]
MIETNKYKLGLFVTAAVVLFILAVTCMGLFDFLSDKAYLRTTVSESVQGLNTGSSVKLRGVPIGKITNITVLLDNKNISIEMEVDLDRFSKGSHNIFSGETISQSEFYQLLRNEVQNGLRCRLEPDGITGMKYLEIDFFKLPPAEKNIRGKESAFMGKYFYIPSTPSMLASLRLSMTDILARIAMIDFDGISKRTTLLLENMNRTLDPKRLDQLISDLNSCVESIKKTADNLGDMLDKKDVNATLLEARKAITGIYELSNELRKNLNDARIPETVAGVRQLTGELGNSTENVDTTLQKLNDAIDALTEFAQYLNDNPASIIHGKSSSGKKTLREEE